MLSRQRLLSQRPTGIDDGLGLSWNNFADASQSSCKGHAASASLLVEDTQILDDFGICFVFDHKLGGVGAGSRVGPCGHHKAAKPLFGTYKDIRSGTTRGHAAARCSESDSEPRIVVAHNGSGQSTFDQINHAGLNANAFDDTNLISGYGEESLTSGQTGTLCDRNDVDRITVIRFKARNGHLNIRRIRGQSLEQVSHQAHIGLVNLVSKGKRIIFQLLQDGIAGSGSTKKFSSRKQVRHHGQGIISRPACIVHKVSSVLGRSPSTRDSNSTHFRSPDLSKSIGRQQPHDHFPWLKGKDGGRSSRIDDASVRATTFEKGVFLRRLDLRVGRLHNVIGADSCGPTGGRNETGQRGIDLHREFSTLFYGHSANGHAGGVDDVDGMIFLRRGIFGRRHGNAHNGGPDVQTAFTRVDQKAGERGNKV
mmetsp:Transcript_7803/g.12278  ORF Transcript_7803/g.12278 Transcript_7803/m.12278 type:complete len:423 (+) Transcript_7803:734-2002(+)